MSVPLKSIPLIYGLKSGCLTNYDWQKLGVVIGAVSLDALLIKPGIENIKTINNIKKWLGWHGEIILLKEWRGTIKDSFYNLTSPYDGAKIIIAIEELNQIATNLNADKIVEDSSTSWIISDTAEQMAIEGKFILDNQIENILEEKFTYDLKILAKNCFCTSCNQGFSRAYLQHLYQQTPLLAHRYLAMHNFFLL